MSRVSVDYDVDIDFQPLDAVRLEGAEPAGSAGTAQALRPLAEAVLAWVATERAINSTRPKGWGDVDEDDLRRIEQCAEAARGLRTGRLDFVGGDPHGEELTEGA